MIVTILSLRSLNIIPYLKMMKYKKSYHLNILIIIMFAVFSHRMNAAIFLFMHYYTVCENGHNVWFVKYNKMADKFFLWLVWSVRLLKCPSINFFMRTNTAVIKLLILNNCITIETKKNVYQFCLYSAPCYKNKHFILLLFWKIYLYYIFLFYLYCQTY